MTVLYFADTRFPIERANGAQTMATCRAMAARGHEVTLVVRPDTSPTPRDPFEFYGVTRVAGLGIETVPTTGGALLRRIRFLWSALYRARRGRQAVIYTRDLGVAVFLLQRQRRRRPRLVYESHGIAPVVSQEMPALLGQPDLAPSARKVRRLDRRERLVWKRAAAYVAITRALSDELTARYGARTNVFVVPDGSDEPIDVPTARPADTHRADPIAAYAGHLYPWKGVDIFVRALALAPGIRGLIVGGHPQERDRGRIEQLARDLGVDRRLEITGHVPASAVAGQLARASMLVLPNTASAISERYTSPLKLFEYLWLGRPIVASDLPAIREVLPESAALFVPPGDARALASALERLAADPVLAASLGQAARGLAPDFTWTKRADRLEAALDAAASAR